MAALYILVCATEYANLGGFCENILVAWFDNIEDATQALETYLEMEYGKFYEFERLITHLDASRCCGKYVNAIDLEGDEKTLWIEKVPSGARRLDVV